MTWFSRLRNWQTDQSNGIGIRSDNHDQEDDNFAVGINASINVAGQNTPTGNLPMGGFRHTGAANGSAATDYATLAQAQSASTSYAVDSVGTDAYAITLSPARTSYTAGDIFSFYPGTANTGAATLNVNGLGAKTIKKDKNTDLADNDIIVGQLVRVIYDGTNFQMISPAYGQISQSGAARYAADAGASDTYAITLSPVAAAYATGMSILFKANTANTGAATINVNGLGAKSIVKDGSLALNDNDIKASQIVEVVYDGTNFQLTSPVSYALSQNASQIYAADAQSSDTYVVTLSPAPAGYTNGMPVHFKANTLNTGAATLNVNSLGAKTIKKFGTTNDLATGDILAAQIVTVIYDGTNFQLVSAVDDIINLTEDLTPDPLNDYMKTWDASATTYKRVSLQNVAAPVATQAQMETGTSITVFVTPGRQQYHPASNKAWFSATYSGTPAIQQSFNIASLGDTGTGQVTPNFTTAFSAATYCVNGTAELDAGVAAYYFMRDGDFSRTTSACQMAVLTSGYSDGARELHFQAWGDQ